MDQDKDTKRREKVTDGAKHRTGTIRAAVKPHKATPSAKDIITTYLSGLGKGTLSQTYASDTLAKSDKVIRSGFGLGASDELYLLCDPTSTGRAGMLLSSSGLRLADGRGSVSSVSWRDLARCSVTSQNGMLVIGQTAVVTRDAKTLLPLLQQLQAKLA